MSCWGGEDGLENMVYTEDSELLTYVEYKEIEITLEILECQRKERDSLWEAMRITEVNWAENRNILIYDSGRLISSTHVKHLNST